MAFKIRAVDRFDRQFGAALQFLEEADSSGKAPRRFIAEFKEVKGYLAQFPNMYAIREDESRAFGSAVRAARVSNFLIYYVVLEEKQEVVLYALRHQLADPERLDWPAFSRN